MKRHVWRLFGGIAMILTGVLVLSGCPEAGIVIDDDDDGGGGGGDPVVTVPATPDALSSSNITHESVKLTWDAVAGASGYVLLRDTASDGVFATTVHAGSATSATDTGLAAQTTYYYRVKATNSAGDSALSGPLAVLTSTAPILAPATPAGFQVDSTTESSVVLSWMPVDGATSYRIYRGDAEPVALTSPLYTGGATSWSDTGLSSDSTYYYALVAVNSAGSSDAATLNATTQAPAQDPPAVAPANVTVTTVSTSELTVTWDAVADAATYVISRATDSGMTDATVVYSGALLTYSDTGLDATSDSFYTVFARNAQGDGPTSTVISGTTLPAVPTGLAAAQSSGDATTELQVAWDAIDATGTGETLTYALLMSDSPTGTYTQVFSDADAFTTVTGLTPGTDYYFRVRALLGSLEGALSSARTATTVATLAAPTGVTVGNPTASTLDVSWAASAGADGYSVSRATSAGGPWTQIADVTSGTAHTDTGLAAGTLYYYRVKAYSAAAGVSAASASDSGTTSPPVPATPDGLTVTPVSSTKLAVSWNASDGATSYVVTRDGSPLSDRLSRSFTDTGLTADTAYTYTVAAKNGSGTSAASDGVAATTYPAPPAVPTGVAVSGATDSSLTVSWDPVTGAGAYKLYLSTDGASYTYRTQVTTTSETVTGLNASTDYSFRVRATNAGGDSADSASASGTTLVGIAAPEWYRSSETDTTATLSWYPVSGATAYTLYRSDSSFGPWDTSVYAGPETEYTDAGLSPETSYYYRLTATDGADVSSLSRVQSVYTDQTPADPPTTPGQPSVQAVTAETITISWSTVWNAQGYVLYRSDGPTVDGTDTPVYVGTGASFTDTGLAASTTYYYAVVATNASGSSGFSSPVGPMTAGVPGTPGWFDAVVVTDTSIVLEWDGVWGSTGYELYRSQTGPVTTADQLVYEGSLAEYRDTGLAPGTPYHYAIRALNEAGASDLLEISTTTTASAPTLEAPTLSIVGAYDDRVELEWNAVANVSEYVVYRSTTTDDIGTGATVLATVSAGSTWYDDEDIDSADQYYYAVRGVAVDVAGALSSAIRAGGISVIIE